jgi:hypothetical protein
VAPSGVGGNEYYPSPEVYLAAVADALHEEYAAIVAAGFTLQIDDPFLTDVFSYGTGSALSKLAVARTYVDAINRSLRGIPRDRVRLHTCYGINEGPRVHDAPLAELIETLFTIEAGAFSFEAANPRHEHAYHVFETVALPPDTVLMPGVISHATNIVEHPEVIADRIVRFAELVGRENVVASADCGFSSQATYRPEIHPTIVWAKFEALAEGARLATARLWPLSRWPSPGDCNLVARRPAEDGVTDHVPFGEAVHVTNRYVPERRPDRDHPGVRRVERRRDAGRDGAQLAAARVRGRRDPRRVRPLVRGPGAVRGVPPVPGAGRRGPERDHRVHAELDRERRAACVPSHAPAHGAQ